MSTLHYLERGENNENSPILLLLHGWAMYAEQMLEMTNFYDTKHHLISARAPIRMGPGSYRWFDFERTPSSGPIINDKEEESSLALLVQFIKDIRRKYCNKPVYLIGHSQGGTMSLSVSLKHPELIAGCANVNGRVLKKSAEYCIANKQINGMHFFHGHGTHNSIVPIKVGRWTGELLKSLNANLTYKEYPIDHEITTESLEDILVWLNATDGLTRSIDCI
jgi:phospholipase/carboxylesterase